MRRARPLLAILSAGLAVLARPSNAEAVCTIAATGVSFGLYNVFSATPLDSTGTITYKCQDGVAAVTLTLTKGASLSFTPRTLQGPVDKLTYNLYLDAARVTIWGNNTGGTSQYSRSNPPDDQVFVLTVYGRIPAGQDVGAGAYSDTITASINF